VQPDLEQADQKRDPADDETEPGREPQRDLAERGDPVDRELEHLGHRVLRRAREALGAVVLDPGLLVADPRDEAADEAVPLARVAQRADDAPAHQPEVAGVDGDRDVREPPDDAVEERGGEQLEAALAVPAPARRVDDVVAVAELGQEVVDELGRVLQVAVHQHDRVAARRVEPRRRRDLVAEVARERDHAQVGIAVGRVEQLLERGVAAPVVDQDQLVRGGRDAQSGDHVADAAQELVDVVGLVEERNDDAERRVRAAPNRELLPRRGHPALFSPLAGSPGAACDQGARVRYGKG